MNFLVLFVAMVVIDALWLGCIAKSLFTYYLPGSIGRHFWTVPAALGAWLLLTIGVYVFVLPLTKTAPLSISFWRGALFGMCVYGVYELTNLAIFPKWALPIVFIDTAWGALLCGIISVLGRYLTL